MSNVILIYDSRHSELQKTEYTTFAEAVEELERRTTIASTEPPNRCPCTRWRTCGRKYALWEFEKTSVKPWRWLRHAFVVEVSPDGVVWNPNYERDWAASGGGSSGGPVM